MGDPKRARRKYHTPSHPWQKDRIDAENELLKKYGLKNKKELWKAQSSLKSFRQQARSLLARVRYGDTQAEKETRQLIDKLARLGIMPEEASLDDILALDIEPILSRRLQSQAYFKGLAYTAKHARQLIVHGHIVVNERKMTVPGYLVKKGEEDSIEYHASSPITHELHPARPKKKEAYDEDDYPPPAPKKAEPAKKPKPAEKPAEEAPKGPKAKADPEPADEPSGEKGAGEKKE